MFLTALCGWMWSLGYDTGMSVAAGRVGAGVFVVVLADLVASAAAAGWAEQGTSSVCPFGGTCIIWGHTFEELGRLKAVVGGAPA